MLKKSFKVNLNIYDVDKIKSWINDFIENEFEIELEEDIILISWENEEEISDIFNELMNYILAL